LADKNVYSTPRYHQGSGNLEKEMRGLSLEEANRIIAATFAAAKKRKCRPMSAIVLDARGPRESVSEAGRRIDAAL